MPIHDMRIAIRMPDGSSVQTARLVFAGGLITGERVGNYLEFTLPRLEAMETLEIGME
jgi:hypothetical protein